MIKTHVVNLTSSLYSNVRDYNYFIVVDDDYEVGDYILFKEVETLDEEVKETGVHKMTKVQGIAKNDGLKDGYVLLFLISLT